MIAYIQHTLPGIACQSKRQRHGKADDEQTHISGFFHPFSHFISIN